MPYYDVGNPVTITKTPTIRQNALWLCKNNCCENMAPSLLQCSGPSRSRSLPWSCTTVSAVLEVSVRSAQKSQALENLSILLVKPRSIVDAPP
jgi:hypothetical protein